MGRHKRSRGAQPVNRNARKTAVTGDVELTERLALKFLKALENLPKRVSVFTIRRRNIYQTSEAIYHKVRNNLLKLTSFGLFLKIPKNALFYKTSRG